MFPYETSSPEVVLLEFCGWVFQESAAELKDKSALPAALSHVGY
jgi:hypothetical protein